MINQPSYYDRVNEAADWVRERPGDPPEVAVVLGSGLGEFAERVAGGRTFRYPTSRTGRASAVVGHAGRLVVGTVRGGTSPCSRAAPTTTRGTTCGGRPSRTRVLGLLGVKTLILTNAAGGMNLVRVGRADGHRRPHQPDRQQPAHRPERRAVRAALPRHERGVLEAAARDRGRGGGGDAARRSRTASTRRCTGRASRRPPRSATCARSAPTPSACPPCPRRSSRGTWGSRCWPSRASRTWPRASSISRSTTRK